MDIKTIEIFERSLVQQQEMLEEWKEIGNGVNGAVNGRRHKIGTLRPRTIWGNGRDQHSTFIPSHPIPSIVCACQGHGHALGEGILAFLLPWPHSNCGHALSAHSLAPATPMAMAMAVAQLVGTWGGIGTGSSPLAHSLAPHLLLDLDSGNGRKAVHNCFERNKRVGKAGGQLIFALVAAANNRFEWR